jgi:putative Ca2+/H+ antiporter (TMEM165/GDT1 family)
MMATIVLVTPFHRPFAVWAGAATAFALHVFVAVAAGGLLGLLPDRVVDTVVGTLFAVGAVVLFRAARSADTLEEVEAPTLVTPWRAAAGAFGLIALAEWGDLTQLATAGLAARSEAPVFTGLGAWMAEASVGALAVISGRQLVARVPIHRISYLGAAVFAALSVWTFAELLTR